MSVYHDVLDRVRGKTEFTIVLAGNPNVGKSTLFNHLTGMGVITANYPGKTVELTAGATEHDGRRMAVVDLPGTYALGPVSEDQWVARRVLLDGATDVVIVVVDAANLERNLTLVLQLLDMELPLVLALNLIDEAQAQGISVSSELLSQRLGVPVVPTVAIHGEGIDRLMDASIACHDRRITSQAGTCHSCALGTCGGCTGGGATRSPEYSKPIAQARDRLAEAIRTLPGDLRDGLSPRSTAMLLLEDDAEVVAAVRLAPGGAAVLTLAGELSESIAAEAGEPTPLVIARERNEMAGEIARQVRHSADSGPTWSDRLWDLSVRPATGLPILAVVLAAVFGLLSYGGNSLSILFTELWSAAASPVLKGIVSGLLGDGVLGRTVLWGLDAGVQAALSVGLSYVLVFYLMLAVLEDTGYFNSIAFLLDSVMHRFGLHGRAVLPLLAAAGCNVPAITGTRVLTTMRERVIASTLIVLIPCGARTAVILGVVGHYAGLMYAAAMFLVVLVLVGVVGLALNAMMPGTGTGFVMEMFPFRMPDLRTTVRKTWDRTEDFVVVAMPVVLVGSLALGLLYETGWVWAFAAPLSPVVEGWLGLPAVAGLTLIFAVLRKELAMQLLVTLAIAQYGQQASDLGHFMSSTQLVVYGLVNTIYIPCVATIAVLGSELGWRRATGISAFTIVAALALGGAARMVLG